MAETNLSDQLQALLTTAREANRATSNRIPLEDFLAGLQHEATEIREKSSLQTQLAIYESFLSVLDGTASVRSDVSVVSKTAQTFAPTASRAVQTDSATISLWDLVPKARIEGYHDGINAGRKAGFEQGMRMNMSESVSRAFEQGKAEGLKMVQEQHEVLELDRRIKLARKSAIEARVSNDLRSVDRAAEEIDEDHIVKDGQVENATPNGMPAKQPHTTSSPVPNKEKRVNSESDEADPFASLVGLLRKR